MIIEYIKNIDEINIVANSLIRNFGDKKIFLFNGNMGAGKTTLIKSICENMGVDQTVNSPTFSIVNEYEAANGDIIYHFDCYRIKNIKEALDLGAEEYLYSGNFCFIEWSENIAPILPDYAVNVNIEENENGIRKVSLDL